MSALVKISVSLAIFMAAAEAVNDAISNRTPGSLFWVFTAVSWVCTFILIVRARIEIR